MSLKRFEGKTVDEALDNAAEELGVERYRLSYHVVVEKRGFLGGTKRVVIEAWEDDFGNRIETPRPTTAPPPPRARTTASPGPGRSEGRPSHGRGLRDGDDRGGGDRQGRGGRQRNAGGDRERGREVART